MSAPPKSSAKAGARSGRLAQTVRFAVIGVLGTLVYFSIAVGLSTVSVDISAAHWTAYAVSQAVSYFGQKTFTFRVEGQHARSAGRYLVAMTILAAAHYLVVLGLDALHLTPTLVFIGASIFYPVASWLIHTFWTFRSPVGAHETST